MERFNNDWVTRNGSINTNNGGINNGKNNKRNH